MAWFASTLPWTILLARRRLPARQPSSLWALGLRLVIVLLALMACGGPTAGHTSTPTATATTTPPTATPVPYQLPHALLPIRERSALSRPGAHHRPRWPPHHRPPVAGGTDLPICSVGTHATVLAFMRYAISSTGWHVTTSSSTSFSATKSSSGRTYQIDVSADSFVTSSPNEWVLTIHVPM